MVDLPKRTITFLFTDIEGSTMSWEVQPDAMHTALARHDAILREAIEAHNGYVFKTVGDAFCATFPNTIDALAAILAAHRALQDQNWGEIGPVRIRAGIHTGIVQERDGDYFGQPLNRVARLMSAAHGSQTLLSQPSYELVRDNMPSGVELRDLGEHRLKDLIRPEHIYQLVEFGLPSDFPPLKTLDNCPNNLPMQHTQFIGKEKEVASVVERIEQQSTRLLTLTGPGGTGKTRLALQVAADLLDVFQDGVYFVNLAPIVDPGFVVSTIAQTVGVKESADQLLIESLCSYLREKHLLLLLDNFEHVLKAAPQVNALLEAAPHLKVLTTSRVQGSPGR
jgi:class 3 adenylate cyclase